MTKEQIENCRNNLGARTLKEIGFPAGATGWDKYDSFNFPSKVCGCPKFHSSDTLVIPHSEKCWVSPNGYFFVTAK